MIALALTQRHLKRAAGWADVKLVAGGCKGSAHPARIRCADPLWRQSDATLRADDLQSFVDAGFRRADMNHPLHADSHSSRAVAVSSVSILCMLVVAIPKTRSGNPTR